MRAASHDIKAQLRKARQIRASFRNDPVKARQWLIKIGVLTKSGKQLVAQYR